MIFVIKICFKMLNLYFLSPSEKIFDLSHFEYINALRMTWLLRPLSKTIEKVHMIIRQEYIN